MAMVDLKSTNKILRIILVILLILIVGLVIKFKFSNCDQCNFECRNKGKCTVDKFLEEYSGECLKPDEDYIGEDIEVVNLTKWEERMN